MFSAETKDWIEVLKLLSSIATPIVVVVLGFKLNSRLKSIDDSQWQSRKIVEKRLELYEKIAPGLNAIFCFCMWVGYWKDLSPRGLIQTKRDLDKTANIYRHLLSEEFYSKYNDFIHLVFLTYTGAGKDALIKCAISGSDGNRRTHSNYEWEDAFVDLFTDRENPTKSQIARSYNDVMTELRKCVGLNSA
ncbi:MAG: hypothetical protein R3E44_07055 [Paracoccaceae bacterium]